MLKLISDRSSGIEQLSHLVGLWLSELMYMYICVCVYMCVWIVNIMLNEWKSKLCVLKTLLEVHPLKWAFYLLHFIFCLLDFSYQPHC